MDRLTQTNATMPARALGAANKERVFHWEFEFPEVFERGGFSAFVGTPHFLEEHVLAQN